jgi:hypothetical protein
MFAHAGTPEEAAAHSQQGPATRQIRPWALLTRPDALDILRSASGKERERTVAGLVGDRRRI